MVEWVKVDKVWKYHIYGFVKTTLIVRDELYRRAKAQAALTGIRASKDAAWSEHFKIAECAYQQADAMFAVRKEEL